VAATTKARRGSKLNLYGGWKAALPFLLPSLIGFIFFFFIPTVRGIYLSFTDWSLIANDGEWVGTENYERLFGENADPLFWNAVKVTAWYVFLNILTQTVLAIFIAVGMDRLVKSSIVRSLIMLPYLIPNVVVALTFVWLLNSNLGIIADFFSLFGIESNYFAGTTAVIPTIAGVNTWRHMGYTALLIFAGLQTIPKSLYEAAAIDGATEWQMMRRITVPLLRPVLALVLVITMIGSFQVFDTVQVATGGFGGRPGGPGDASRVIYVYIYELAFARNELGRSSAIAVLLLLTLIVITFFQLRLLRANESDLA